MDRPIGAPPSLLDRRYTLVRELGGGASALVFELLDREVGRHVAMKVLRPELASAIGRDRFLREVQVASGLRHPHLVPVLDFGETDGVLWYTMPCLNGGTLRDRLRREPQLRVPDAARLLSDIADALAFTHARGVLHRDVKPENILLEEEHAWLADFGIARTLDAVGVATLTSAGIAVGTPAYMSPEQASGARDLDGRTDSFALACVLYEALAGVPPYVGATAQSVIAQRFAHAPHPITSYRRGLSATIVAAMDGGLAMVPADRLTAAELRDLLRAELTGERTAVSGRVLARTPSHGVAAHGMDAHGTSAPATSSGSTTAPAPRATTVAVVPVRWAAAAAVLFVVSAFLLWPRGPANAGDPNKIVVFPLAPASAGDATAEQVAGLPILLASTLDGVPPLRWVEWDRLGGVENARDASAAHRTAAQRVGAGHFVDGTVFVRGDSVRVLLRLVATGTDSVVARSSVTAAGRVEQAAAIALRAVGPLLVPLLDPGRSSAIAPLIERDPVAVGAFLAGERAYRQAQYERALSEYERALAADSQLAMAALKGARAARSLFRDGDEARLLAVALAPDWADAHAALGDVYLYVGTDDVRADSAARVHYERALRADAGFALTHYHLAWLALLRGDADGAERALAAYVRADSAPSAFTAAVPSATACLRRGPGAVNWPAVDIAARVLAGKMLVGGGAQLPCAEAAFARALATPGGVSRDHFSGLLGVHAIAVARGDSARAWRCWKVTRRTGRCSSTAFRAWPIHG